jgi:hypothetical protein
VVPAAIAANGLASGSIERPGEHFGDVCDRTCPDPRLTGAPRPDEDANKLYACRTPFPAMRCGWMLGMKCE